ncbi:uncharacterized protein LOC115623448 [Scaptodrosophila lebanonensis]|uniref:Uncharacterized protein LOC115623448 n=1 Tax=Drosophila lebanonensis TaxID=7225 RepID=A0A6J2TCC6_DROLE|nr:uncharacterized protein LOC115623448 [Scaptodrosophila lebanonensis]
MARKPLNFKDLSCEAPPEPRSIQLEGEKKSVGETLNFLKMTCEREPKPTPRDYPTVADELNARLGMLQVRPNRSPAIKRLVTSRAADVQHMYKLQCICPPFHPCYLPCQHTGQIIIDRDVLTREEHLCFLATPKKDMGAPRKPPHCYQKRIPMPTCTARVERLADPHPMHVKDTWKYFKNLLSPRHVRALEAHLMPKPPVEIMPLDKALEYIEEENRLQRVAKQLHRRRCRSLKKRILQRQRKQMRKIICVLFEEMKDFLLNDQFIIDEHSPLCAVILERIKDFTDEEFYTTSNLREYQRILANNLTVWINKFISNLNIYLAPQQIAVQRPIMHAEDPEQFVPLSDYISVSEVIPEEAGEEFPMPWEAYEDLNYDEDYLPDVLDNPVDQVASENTLVND